ncbi:VOC family protein [Fulvivirga lutea]|uniref:VOC family protein n=1 Tax=Fulvivirga lutea TaxID=2810512 RepID=A0A974WHK4_9BACT|nr:VOC family protein [Fulvivirga lutea]QSE98684.1 VOC family protein [Fulvivirga lutea]
MKLGLSMVTLGVRDLRASIKFYHEGLGLPILESPPGAALLQLNGKWIEISIVSHIVQEAGMKPDCSGYSGINLTYTVSSEQRVFEILSRAKEAGGDLVKKAHKAEWGGCHGYFMDLDKHLWEVVYNPFNWLGGKG